MTQPRGRAWLPCKMSVLGPIPRKPSWPPDVPACVSRRSRCAGRIRQSRRPRMRNAIMGLRTAVSLILPPAPTPPLLTHLLRFDRLAALKRQPDRRRVQRWR